MNYTRFVYTNDSAVVVDWTTTLPTQAWNRSSEAIGGAEWSAARVPSSFEIRRDQLLGLTIRIKESEWPAVRTMLEHGQRGTQVTVYPQNGTGVDAYLVSPAMGERIQYRRSDFPGHLEVDMTWMAASDVDSWDAFEFYG